MAAHNRSVITNKVLLQHMQAGHEALRTEITRAIRRLDVKIETMQKDISGLKDDIVELKENDRKTHAALQRLYEKRMEMVEQLTDHEKRLVYLEKTAAHAG